MTKSKPKTTDKSLPTTTLPTSLLLDIDDELNELMEIIAFLPELRRMVVVMRDIVQPPNKDRVPGNSDRIGVCAKELFNQSLDKHLTSSAEEFIDRVDTESSSELVDAVDMITYAVQWRLYRIQALVGIAVSL